MTDNFLDHVVVCFKHCNNVLVLESYYVLSLLMTFLPFGTAIAFTNYDCVFGCILLISF